MDKITILVISDLHCISNKESELQDSKMLFSGHHTEFGDSLIESIKSTKREIDILVCPGDISNKGCLENLKKGLSFIHKISNDLGVDNIIISPGNHDHQSRSEKNNFSPVHGMKFIDPMFPTSCHEKNTNFWAWHWTSIEEEKYNAIIINTSAYHGFDNEQSHGRIAKETVDQIKRYVKSNSFPKEKLNILVFHHHPTRMSHTTENDDIEVMTHGDYLINALNDTKIPWLIIHGHKHYPNIFYPASERSPSIVVMSAGSVSAQIYDSIKNLTANQYYILEIDLEKTKENEIPTGTFITNEYNIASGWHFSKSKKLPSHGGFGDLRKSKAILKEFQSMISPGMIKTNSEAEPFRTIVKNLTPVSFDDLIEELKKENIHVEIEDGLIVEVGYGK